MRARDTTEPHISMRLAWCLVLLVCARSATSAGQWRPFWRRRALLQPGIDDFRPSILFERPSSGGNVPFMGSGELSAGVEEDNRLQIRPSLRPTEGEENRPSHQSPRPSEVLQGSLMAAEPLLQRRPELAQVLQSHPDLPVSTTFLKEASDEEIARFLNLLTLVRFPNAPCETSLSGLRGTCYPESECRKLGGTPSQEDPCAQGFGVCCVFRVTCGGVARINGTYFESPGFPLGVIAGEQPEACLLKIEKSHALVVQLRLDLEVFELSSPNRGECDRDQMVISGQDPSSPVPQLCGVNTGQHVYLEMLSGLRAGPVTISVVLSGPTSGPILARRWRVRVTQLTPRDLPLAAPSHCLQYHTARSGLVQSFNYIGATGYMNDLNYAVCIRKESGACSVTYRNYDYNGTQYRFQLVNYDGGQSIVPPNQAGAGVFNCPDDYIVVGGVRLCGEKLNDATRNIDFTVNAPVTDTSSGPFILPVRTNGGNVGRGFNLSYTQNACQ